MSSLIEKIEEKLVSLGIVKLAESGSTSGETIQVTSAAPGVVVSEIIPATIKISYSAIGAPVIQTNEDGKEENVTDGEYILTTNKKITVENGKLLKEEDVEEMEIEPAESGTTEMEMVTLTKAEYDENIRLANVERQRIADLIDLNKNGDYTINLHVEDGVITYGTLYTSTYENLLMAETQKYDDKFTELSDAFETKLADEKLKYENIIEALKVGTSTDLNKPISDSSQSQTKLSRVEVLKAQLKNK